MPPPTTIHGTPVPETLTGSGIAILAPGYRGQVTQLDPVSGGRAVGDPLPIAIAAANADVVIVSQLVLNLAPPPAPAEAAAGRAVESAPPKLILPKRDDADYAALQTGEDGFSLWIFPVQTDTSVVFELAPGGTAPTAAGGRAAITSAMRATIRVVAWLAKPVLAAGALSVARAWESGKRPYGLRKVTPDGELVAFDWHTLEPKPWLFLIHGTFSTPEACFAGWLGSSAFKATIAKYGGRCVALAHPSLSASPDDNIAWMLQQLPPGPGGPVDVVCHSRGGLVARRLATSDRLTIRHVCQVGTPNVGTPLAHAKHLISFIDAHTALLTHLPDTVSTIVLEGILCIVKLVAIGLGHGLPGLAAMEPDGAYLAGLRQRALNAQCWFTVGADYQPRVSLSSRFIQCAAGSVVDGFFGSANDLVVPSDGCHLPGPTVADSLRLRGADVHHCNYFSNAQVHDRLTAWLTP